MTDDFVPGGGSELVFEWATQISGDDALVVGEFIWTSLDDPLRLALVQRWLMDPGRDVLDSAPDRDATARELAAIQMSHPAFPRFLAHIIRGFQSVYADLDGHPCLIDVTEPVGVDMELVLFTSEQYVGTLEAEAAIPAHSFITRFADGEWRIAATARRLPVPGWPPTAQTLPGLSIDRPPAA